MVPRGMECPGSARSPERLAPSIIPTTAGKTNAKTRGILHRVPTVECGLMSHCPDGWGSGNIVWRRPYLPVPLVKHQLRSLSAELCAVHAASHDHGLNQASTPCNPNSMGVNCNEPRSATMLLLERCNQTEPTAAASAVVSPRKMKKFTRANAAAPRKATKKRRNSTDEEKASSFANVEHPGQRGSKKVWNTTSVKDRVLNVTLRQ
mmetsp:Transcript_12594/g.38486  ORF Transcript_12594/g.38486 Transcript_12594/m.38486 type:complete len:206 (-) Transcript_12594:424-1041(-)